MKRWTTIKRKCYYVAAEMLERRQLLATTAAIQTLVSFEGTDGALPLASIASDAAGNLFGTTSAGQGPSNLNGTVFKIAAGTRAFSTVAVLPPPANGDEAGQALPNSLTFAPGGDDLYGTTQGGGDPARNGGILFEVASGSQTVTTLAEFELSSGDVPLGGVVFDSSGNIYGTTTSGGPNIDYEAGDPSYGTVYEMAAGTDTLTALASFDDADGAFPAGNLVVDASGNIFGTTQGGGPNSDGTVFELAAGSHALTTIASFDGTNGSTPNGLQLGSDGNLYGTTQVGGQDGDGTVFDLSPSTNHIVTLASFTGSTGVQPEGNIVVDLAGNVYGTTYSGGASSDGTVFEVAAESGTVTTLASFNGVDGSTPVGGVIADNTGNLYGTTSLGGDLGTGAGYGDGTVFELADVVALPVGKLVFSSPPTQSVEGSALDGPNGLQVSVEDDNGEVLTDNNSTVTLTLSGGTFSNGATTASATAVDGVATFSGLVVNSAGTYSLDATDGAFSPAASGPFNVVAPLNKLVFLSTPQDTTAGSASTIEVAVENSSGQVVASQDPTVTLALSAGDFSTGSASTSAAAVQGVATFSGVAFEKAGADQLSASDGVDTPATSNTVTVGPGTPIEMAFSSLPIGGTRGAALSPEVQISIVDVFGNVATTSDATIALRLDRGVFGGGKSTLAASAVNGVATFSNIVINNPGSHTLTASAPGLATSPTSVVVTRGLFQPVTSPTFQIGPVPVTPGEQVSIPSQLLSTGQIPEVRFYNTAGFSVTETPTSLTDLTVPAPVFVNDRTGVATAGTVSVSVGVAGGTEDLLPYQYRISVPPPIHGRPGALTLSFIQQAYSNLQQAETSVLAVTDSQSQQAVANDFGEKLASLATMEQSLGSYLSGSHAKLKLPGFSPTSRAGSTPVTPAALHLSDQIISASSESSTSADDSDAIYQSDSQASPSLALAVESPQTTYDSPILNQAAARGSNILAAASYATAFGALLAGPEGVGGVEGFFGAMYAVNALSAAFQSAMVKVDLAIEDPSNISNLNFQQEGKFLTDQAVGYVAGLVTSMFVGSTGLGWNDQSEQVFGAFVDIAGEKLEAGQESQDEAQGVLGDLDNDAESAIPESDLAFPAEAVESDATNTSYGGDWSDSQGGDTLDVGSDGDATLTITTGQGAITVTGVVDSNGYIQVTGSTIGGEPTGDTFDVSVQPGSSGELALSGWYNTGNGDDVSVNSTLQSPNQTAPTNGANPFKGDWTGSVSGQGFAASNVEMSVSKAGIVSIRFQESDGTWGPALTGNIGTTGSLNAANSQSSVSMTFTLPASGQISGIGTASSSDLGTDVPTQMTLALS